MNRLWFAILLTLGACSKCISQSLYTPPALPMTSVDTSWAATPITGVFRYVTAGSDIDQNGRALQTAIDQAAYGDAVVVPAGYTYRIGSLELRTKPGTGFITLMSSEILALPPIGNRVHPTDASLMPKLVSPGGNVPVLLTEPAARGYRLVGLEVTKLKPSDVVQELAVVDAQFGTDATQIENLNDFPSDIIIDRCYLHGFPESDLKRDLRLHCNNCAVVDSYVSEAHVIGQDSQAIMLGGKNIKIDNDYVEGAAENIFAADYHSLRTSRLVAATTTTATLESTEDLEPGVGIAFNDGITNIFTTVRSVIANMIIYDQVTSPPGPAAVAYWGLIPTDIEISHSYFAKQLSWNTSDPTYTGYGPLVKNLLELKSGQRIWIHDNVFRHTWNNGQTGNAILFTVRNEGDLCFFCVVEDVTFENNIVDDAVFGVQVLNTDYNYPSGPTRRILLRNNEWLRIGWNFIENSISDLTVDHNTATIGAYFEEVEDGAVRFNNVDINNVVMSHYYAGFHYSNGNAPDWDAIFPGWTLKANVLSEVGDIPPYIYMSAPLETGNYTVNDPSGVGFIDYYAGNLQIGAASLYRNGGTDGKDIGADIEYLSANQSSIESGLRTQSLANSNDSNTATPDNSSSGTNQSASNTSNSGDRSVSAAPAGENLKQFWFDPSTLINPNLPTTIASDPNATLTSAHLAWRVPGAQAVEVRVGSPDGPLFTGGGSEGSAIAAGWVSDGLTFYLQDTSGGKALTPSNTIGVLVAHLGGPQAVPQNKIDLESFFIDPATLADPNLPTTVRVLPWDVYGVAHLVWHARGTTAVEIHVGSPTGTLFTRGGSDGTAVTGPWVTDGLTFYLQDCSNNKALELSNTIAILRIHLSNGQETANQRYGYASFFLNPGALVKPGEPRLVAAVTPGGLGIANLEWNAPNAKAVEIHLGSPTGQLFARLGSVGYATTGAWVSDGMIFYLQDVSEGKELNDDNTLAILQVHVAAAHSTIAQPIGMASFFIDRSSVPDLNNPTTISNDPGSNRGTVHLFWNSAVQHVEIHVGSSNGPLLAGGGAEGEATATGWVSDGMAFYLQGATDGNVTLPSNTLAVLITHVSSQ